MQYFRDRVVNSKKVMAPTSYLSNFFSENFMIIKNIGPRGGHVSLTALDPPMATFLGAENFNRKYNVKTHKAMRQMIGLLCASLIY